MHGRMVVGWRDCCLVGGLNGMSVVVVGGFILLFSVWTAEFSVFFFVQKDRQQNYFVILCGIFKLILTKLN